MKTGDMSVQHIQSRRKKKQGVQNIEAKTTSMMMGNTPDQSRFDDPKYNRMSKSNKEIMIMS